MTRIGNLILGCLLMMLWASTAFAENSSDQSAIACNRGPIFRNFGGTWWFVYACTDNESLALVSLPYNPACPYQFVISKAEDGRYTVTVRRTPSFRVSRNQAAAGGLVLAICSATFQGSRLSSSLIRQSAIRSMTKRR